MSDQLIYAMSTRTELRLDQFNEIFKKVYFPGGDREEDNVDVDMRRQVIRFLDSLGFCEVDFGERMVNVCPPSLVLLPHVGTPRAVLIGARTPSVLAKLKTAVRRRHEDAVFLRHPQNNLNINIPASIVIGAVNTQILEEIAEEANVQCDISLPVSWKLANFSSSAQYIERSLSFERRQEPNWSRRIFQKNKLMFNKFQEKHRESLELAEYINPLNQQRRHWLWKDEVAAEVERDWGRFIVLSQEKFDIMLYDERLHNLAVPITVPLPCILARALAMCSGMVPLFTRAMNKSKAAIPAGFPLQVYLNVTPQIAELVSERLGQNLILCPLEDIKNRVG